MEFPVEFPVEFQDGVPVPLVQAVSFGRVHAARGEGSDEVVLCRVGAVPVAGCGAEGVVGVAYGVHEGWGIDGGVPFPSGVGVGDLVGSVWPEVFAGDSG